MDYLECKLKTTNFPAFSPQRSGILKSRQFLLCNRGAQRQNIDISASSKQANHYLNCIFLLKAEPRPAGIGERLFKKKVTTAEGFH